MIFIAFFFSASAVIQFWKVIVDRLKVHEQKTLRICIDWIQFQIIEWVHFFQVRYHRAINNTPTRYDDMTFVVHTLNLSCFSLRAHSHLFDLIHLFSMRRPLFILIFKAPMCVFLVYKKNDWHHNDCVNVVIQRIHQYENRLKEKESNRINEPSYRLEESSVKSRRADNSSGRFNLLAHTYSQTRTLLSTIRLVIYTD